MRILLVAILVLCQTSACNLYYSETVDPKPPHDHLTIFDLAVQQNLIDSAVSDLYGWEKSKDLYEQFKDFEFDAMQNNDEGKDCGYGKSEKSFNITNEHNLSILGRRCVSSFLITKKSKEFLKNDLRFDVTYFAYNYVDPSGTKFYDNIKFRIYTDNGEHYFLESLPGFETTVIPTLKQKIFTLKIPNLIGKNFSGIKIEFENSISNMGAVVAFPNEFKSNPAKITINSVNQLVTQ